MGGKHGVTLEDLYRVPENGKAEIVDGELVLMTPAGGLHGYAVGLIYASLLEYAHRTGRGVALPDNVGFIVNLPRRRSFSPDVAFWTGAPLTAKFPEGAPIFAVEVRSEEDYGIAAEREMAAKRADYFAAGTLVVWDVDTLDAGVIRVYRSSNPAVPSVYSLADRAEAEPALPGWSMPVVDLFPLSPNPDDVRKFSRSELPEHNDIRLSADGTYLLVNTPGADMLRHAASSIGVQMEALNLETFVADSATGGARTELPACASPAWSPDGSKLACANDQGLTILDVDGRKEVERVDAKERNSHGAMYVNAPNPSAWSPDGRKVLVSVYGENSSSTSSQSDYFILDLTSKTWTRAATGNSAVWLPDGRAIVYTTPRDLTPLPSSGPRKVWSAHLAMFDLATSHETLLTSGVTNNEGSAFCSGAPIRP